MSNSQSSSDNYAVSNNKNVDLNIVEKVIVANSLEQEGNIAEAIAAYQEIVELDQGGPYGNVAQQALDNLNDISDVSSEFITANVGEIIGEDPTIINVENPIAQSKPNRPELLNFFYDLPIRRKQFTTVLATQLFSVLGVVGIGALLIINTGRNQLLQQASSELEVAKINYGIKINQMGFGFAGQADNKILIDAATNKQPSSAAKLVLIRETWKRQIEFATLVDENAKIISNAGLARYGEKFDPQGLVTQALKNDRQIKSTEVISYQDLFAESPRFAELILKEKQSTTSKEDILLVRYTVTPVKDDGGIKLGALISGDIVKSPIVAKTLESFKGGYSGVYQIDSDGKFKPAVSLVQAKNGKVQSQLISDISLIEQAAASNEMVTGISKINGKTHTLAAQSISNYAGRPIAVLVRGTAHDSLNALIFNSLAIQGLVLLVVVAISGAIANYLGNEISQPIEKLQRMAQDFASGDRNVRAKVKSQDEVGRLTQTFNRMADSIVASETELMRISEEQQLETEQQRQAKESLQQEVMSLLLQIEGAQQGDLTVKAPMTEGVVGSIADAFNSTISNLRDLVLKVQKVSNEVNELSQNSENSINQLSTKAGDQVGVINVTLNKISQINNSIQEVDGSTQKAAKIARVARNKAQKGDWIVEQTVESIENIRTTVAGTTKKVKQLAESSQEIAQIVEIISGISEKTNLLAFNASIEASRAGEHGEGFRIVAEEVRGLADRVTESTKDIQHLVTNIQKETAEVLQAMEQGNAQVVHGTDLVHKTKLTLNSIVAISEQIDEQLQFISSNTTEQSQSSQDVNLKMVDVAGITENTSTEAKEVARSLQELVKEAEMLRLSVSQFRVEART
ncbi:methyl-accepting chemotaxis protein [Xenococcus sp. PCC 7305]|uniref:methyl-accepting chemotaxis protein n=1 Tax=Xenococcus sp. PCC 7305 TaxID=102125 RepID=UPI0002ABC8A4|nr:HAMP domain-containing methyl-accepting chemotaxis protein [Xenococcus sp. PCC 7305]ELS02993.1 methyl-accepting chemotaxis protein [Xenococcus sp. PCC 7305]